MSARRAPLRLLVLVLALAPSIRARASCNTFPYDALCGSFVSSGASSGSNSVAHQEIDAVSTVADQSLGPAYTERLADPTNQAGEGNIVHESSRENFSIDQGVMA